MNAATEFDAEAIRGEEFKSAKAFSVAKKKILDVLVDSIAHFEFGGEGNPQIEIARDLELKDYTQKLLTSSFRKAHASENLEELHRLHGIALELAGDPVYNYAYPEEVLSYEEVIAEMGLQKQFLTSLKELRGSMTRESHDRIMLARNLAREVDETTPTTKRSSFLKAKTLIGCNILENNLSAALHNQENLVKGLRIGSLKSTPIEMLSEHSILVTIHLAVGNTNLARQHAIRMGALPTRNPREERHMNTFFINNTFSLAEKTLNMDILEQGLERFQASSEYLSTTLQAVQLRVAAVVTYYNGEFKKALRLLTKLESINSSAWESFSWLIRLVELNALIELNDWEQFDYSLTRAKRAIDEDDGPYPKAILQFLEKAGKHYPHQPSDIELLNSLAQFDQLEEDSKSMKQMQVFDFRVFLKSKLNQMPMLEVVKSDESARWRLVSGMMD